MIEPILSLAMSIHSSKGVYALLLGSGVSRSAGIPTGWEVTLDFIRRIAKLKAKDCEPDPEAWFHEEYGEEPAYSTLLESVAKSPAERNKILRSYFEPNEDEQEAGLKTPTSGHKAIAKLVASGHIRVIITTNFDRILEKALDEVGITPTVISTDDQAKGAIPLTHTECTIVKVNGDYLDYRIRNTPTELSKYPKGINALLDRIFDEYGLIICGWSGDWDIALRSSLERCKNHRFSTYWAARGKPRGEEARQVIQLRRAVTVVIKDSDSFFSDLLEAVISLEEINRPHPLSSKVAAQRMKRYLADRKFEIPLHDLIGDETDVLYRAVSVQQFPLTGQISEDEFLRRVGQYEAASVTVAALLAIGCFWGKGFHDELWKTSIERVASRKLERNGQTWFLNLQQYPTLLLLYCAGIGAIAARQYGTLKSLLVDSIVRESGGYNQEPIVYSNNVWKVMDQQAGQKLPGMDSRYTPLSDYLFNHLRDTLREVILDDNQYEQCFDRFEYFLAATYLDLKINQDSPVFMPPIGCFGWKMKRRDNHVHKDIQKELLEQGNDWPPIQAGFFGGSVDRASNVTSELLGFVSQLPWY